MTKNIKLLLSCGAVAALGVLAIQGCSSSGDDSSTPSGGSAGTSAGGGSAGKAGGSSAGTSSGGSGTAGTTAGGAPAGGTGGAAGAATTGEAGESAGGAGADLVDCTTFCSDEEATCTFGAADVAPYADSTACMTACMGFTPGDVAHDGLTDPNAVTSGDTFACRRWHLSKAGSTPGVPATAATHCPHTGLLSKTAYADTTATGPCSG